jgi:preprotein translocase subunit SecG
MNIAFNVILAIQILTALAMVGLVLIQHGKGADMGASFGSGASGSLFGASGSANFLSRSTAVCAVVFFAATLWLAYYANDRPKAPTGSILDRPAAGASAPVGGSSGAAAIPAAAIPSTAPVPVPPSATSSAVAPPAAIPTAPRTSASGAGAIPQN